jgi:hypothetical protein
VLQQAVEGFFPSLLHCGYVPQFPDEAEFFCLDRCKKIQEEKFILWALF